MPYQPSPTIEEPLPPPIFDDLPPPPPPAVEEPQPPPTFKEPQPPRTKAPQPTFKVSTAPVPITNLGPKPYKPMAPEPYKQPVFLREKDIRERVKADMYKRRSDFFSKSLDATTSKLVFGKKGSREEHARCALWVACCDDMMINHYILCSFQLFTCLSIQSHDALLYCLLIMIVHSYLIVSYLLIINYK